MSPKSSKPLRIAIVTELEWPLRRHYEIVKGIQEYAASNEDWDMEVVRYPEVLMEAGVHFDGLIGRISKDLYRAAEEKGIPMVNVMIGSGVLHQVPSIVVDIRAAAIMAGEHLINRGMSKLVTACESGQNTSRFIQEEVGSLAEKYQLPFRSVELPVNIESSSEHWRRAREALINALQGWNAPVGLITNTDMHAQVIITLIRDLGWKVPTDIATVSMGNQETICTGIEPTLSSIDLNYMRNGYEAARLLAGLLCGEAGPEEPLMVYPKSLVARGSSDVYAVGDAEVQKALRFIADNSHMPISVSEITASTDVCRQTLERRFRKELNTSIYNELHRLRIERAKRILIEDTSVPVKNLGIETGFATRSNFFAAFKKQTGMSPAEYRETFSDPERW